MHAQSENIGAYLKSAFAGAGRALAAGAGDATEVTGGTIDRLGYHSAVLAIAFTATLAEDETLSFAVEYEESADGSSWDAAVALQAATVAATGDTGGTTETGVVEFDLSLLARKRYIRFNVTPNLSAGATDVATWAAVATLGGASTLPAA